MTLSNRWKIFVALRPRSFDASLSSLKIIPPEKHFSEYSEPQKAFFLKGGEYKIVPVRGTNEEIKATLKQYIYSTRWKIGKIVQQIGKDASYLSIRVDRGSHGYIESYRIYRNGANDFTMYVDFRLP